MNISDITSSLNDKSTIPIYSSASFRWQGKQGKANMSDLIQIGRENRTEGDVHGILIKSTTTGEVKFFIPYTHKSAGNSLIYMYNDISVQIYKK